MRLRFPATLHSWQPSFKPSSSAQQFAKNPSRRNQLFASCPRCEFSNKAQELAQRKIETPHMLEKTTPKRSRTPISGARKPAAYESLTEKLALRAYPTLLYRASSNSNYFFGCYAVGGGLFAAAWFNFQTQFYVRSGGVPQWVPAFTSIGSFMIACASFWMFLKPQNMVRAISCLPSSAKPGHGLGSRSLLLQIERTSTLPFKQPKLVTVPPSDVTISSHIFNDNAEQRLEATIAEIARRDERRRAFAKTNILTLPFRQSGYWIWRGLVGIRSAFTAGGFHYLHVRGNNRAWKLDMDPAWALDDGRALDRLVQIKLG